MKNCLTFLLLCCSLTAFSQPVEKKGTFTHYVRMIVFNPDSAYSTELMHIGTFGVANEEPGSLDTFTYQMKPFDSVAVHFGLYDDLFMVGYDGSDPFGERLIYGDPVYNFQYDDGSSGDSYSRDWSFKDSALFYFSMNLQDSPNAAAQYYVRLLPPPAMPESPATVEEPLPIPDFAVYPNPSAGEVTIHQPDDLVTYFELLDGSGRIVREWYAAGTQTVDISELQSGMYVLRVRNSVYPGNVRLQKI